MFWGCCGQISVRFEPLGTRIRQMGPASSLTSLEFGAFLARPWQNCKQRNIIKPPSAVQPETGHPTRRAGWHFNGNAVTSVYRRSPSFSINAL